MCLNLISLLKVLFRCGICHNCLHSIVKASHVTKPYVNVREYLIPTQKLCKACASYESVSVIYPSYEMEWVVWKSNFLYHSLNLDIERTDAQLESWQRPRVSLKMNMFVT